VSLATKLEKREERKKNIGRVKHTNIQLSSLSLSSLLSLLMSSPSSSVIIIVIIICHHHLSSSLLSLSIQISCDAISDIYREYKTWVHRDVDLSSSGKQYYEVD